MTRDKAGLKSLSFVIVIYRRQVLLLLACLTGTQNGWDTRCVVELLESVAFVSVCSGGMSAFRSGVNEVFTVLSSYAAYVGNSYI